MVAKLILSSVLVVLGFQMLPCQSLQSQESRPKPVKAADAEANYTIESCKKVAPRLYEKYGIYRQWNQPMLGGPCTVANDGTVLAVIYLDPVVNSDAESQDAKRFCERQGWQLPKLVSPSLVAAVQPVVNTNDNAWVDGVFDEQLKKYVWMNTTIPIPVVNRIPSGKCVFTYLGGLNNTEVTFEAAPCNTGLTLSILCASK